MKQIFWKARLYNEHGVLWARMHFLITNRTLCIFSTFLDYSVFYKKSESVQIYTVVNCLFKSYKQLKIDILTCILTGVCAKLVWAKQNKFHNNYSILVFKDPSN